MSTPAERLARRVERCRAQIAQWEAGAQRDRGETLIASEQRLADLHLLLAEARQQLQALQTSDPSPVVHEAERAVDALEAAVEDARRHFP